MATLPSLSGLRAFEAAARHLSFTRAAEELNVTQTAISHLIRRLEEQLGIRLFVRRNRALELTREAEVLPAVRCAPRSKTCAVRRRGCDARTRRGAAHGQHDGLAGGEMAGDPHGRVPGRPSRHRGAHHHLARTWSISSASEVDMAVRYGRGNWPGLRAQWLMAEDIFPVCSPALLHAAKAAAPAGGPRAPHPAARDGVTRGLAALARPPPACRSRSRRGAA